jgi:hypothetical protein
MHDSKVIDAPGLVPRDQSETENKPAPSKLAEVAVRVLGTVLVLYRYYVPNSEYYKVDHTSAQ